MSLLLLVDLDGVVYRGAEPVPGVAEVLADRASRGDDVVYVTNNSMHYRADYVTRLAIDGLPGLRGARSCPRRGRRRCISSTTSRGSAACWRRCGWAGTRAARRRARCRHGRACCDTDAPGRHRWLDRGGCPRRRGDRPRPEPDVPAPGGGRRLCPCRGAVHRHQPGSGLSDRARLATGGRCDRCGARSIDRGHAADDRQARVASVRDRRPRPSDERRARRSSSATRSRPTWPARRPSAPEAS